MDANELIGFTKEEFALKGYIDRITAMNYIGISANLLCELTKNNVINFAVYSGLDNGQFRAGYYKKSDLDELIYRRKEFEKQYYSVSEFARLVPYNSALRKVINRNEVPLYARGGKFGIKNYCFSKQEYDLVCGQRDSFIDELYSISEARQLLPLSVLSVFGKKIDIPDHIKLNGKNKFGSTSEYCFNKDQIDVVVEKRKSFMEIHYTIEEAKNIIKLSIINKECTKVDIPQYAIGGKFGSTSTFCYSKQQVNNVIGNLIAKERLMKSKTLSSEILDLKDTLSYLNMNEVQIRNCTSDGLITPVRFDIQSNEVTCFNKLDLDHIINLRDIFEKAHYTYSEACNYITNQGWLNINKVDIPAYARGGKFTKKDCAVMKKDVESLKNSKYWTASYNMIKEVSRDLYYTSEEVRIILKMDSSTLRKVCIENNITVYQKGSNKYYLRDEIEILRQQQSQLLEFINETCVTYEEGCKKYSRTRMDTLPKDKIKSIPIIVRPYFNKLQALYNKSDIEEEIARLKKYMSFNNVILSSSPSDLFDKKLEIYNEIINNRINEFQGDSPFTYSRWIDFVHRKLEKSKATKQVIVVDVNIYINSTEILASVLKDYNKKEIYQLETREILEFYAKTPKQHVYFINLFLLSEYREIQKYLHKHSINGKNIYKCFALKEYVKKNQISNKELISSEVYTPKEFIECIEYAMNMDLHIKNSLLEIRTSGTINYVSNWLYVLIHLNNGWRNGDARDFKRPNILDYLDEFSIKSPEWFTHNRLSLYEARLILSKIVNEEIIINKTRLKGYFFCSDDLAIQVATAICIISTYSPSVDINSKDEFLKFYTKYNNPTSKQLKKFFKDNMKEDFIFKSRKMNCTLLSLIYVMTLEDDKDKALLLAQRLRAHKWKKSVLHYIRIEKKDIQFLSRQLFERGEFGYAYDLLLSKMNPEMKQLIFEDRTEKIKKIKQSFASYFHIELVSNLFNSNTREKLEVFHKIEAMSYEEGEITLEKIYTGCLPSKELNTQCFISSQNCPKYGGNANCRNCMKSIHKLYAISSICYNATKNIEEYHKETIIGEKIKLSIKIDSDLDLISEAIQKHGKELVYSYMNISREKYLSEIENYVEPAENLYLMSDYLE